MQWVKTFHIVFVIGWMTCLFTLPRALLLWKKAGAAGKNTDAISSLAVKLFRFGSLMALLTATFGVWLSAEYGIGGKWLHIKLALVAGLVAHFLASGRLLLIARRTGTLPLSDMALRAFNELPLVLMIPIIYLVVAKPV